MIQQKTVPADKLAELVVEGIHDKKGRDVVCLDLRKVSNAVCEFFVVCTAGSDRQVGAVADNVEKTVKENCQQKPWHVEGKQNMEWVLIDYFDVVVHIFKPDAREFYGLEELWADGKEVNFDIES